MSYILEALKKAQAERQLGSTPGIHDAPPIAPVAAPPAGNSRLWLALGAALLLAAGGVAIVRMLGSREAPSAIPAVVAAQVPLVPAASAVPPVRIDVPPPAPVPAPVKAVEAPPPEPPLELAQAPAAPPQREPQAAPVQQVQPVVPAEPDDALPTLAELPPALRSGVPQVTLGGYIYSPVPAERLLLVDKNLRREGEEVGPGLVLERLLPRAAVMNYRGTRFRMPY